jgi:uncharacterized membrane-anchored protein
MEVMDVVLWIIGALVFLSGVGALFRRRILWGLILIVVGMALGGWGFFA